MGTSSAARAANRAFVLGTATANLLGVRAHKRSFRATLLWQASELLVLIGLAVGGGLLPNACVVPIISFIAALQNTSFGKLGPYSFNSAMTTGNLRDATTGLVLWIKGREPAENHGKAITLGWICLSFLAGALCGGSYTRYDSKHALLLCAGPSRYRIFVHLPREKAYGRRTLELALGDANNLLRFLDLEKSNEA